MQPYVKTNIDNRIATVEFFHPKSNSLPSELLYQLASNFSVLGENKDVHVIILKSAGEKTFCAGASFDELMQITNHEEGIQFFSGFANVINAMRKCPKFIIARIQGKCVGGGVGLASAADYAIGTTQAAVKLSELSINIGPFVISPAVERKIGKAALGTLAIDAANFYSSEWAFAKGLFNKLVNTNEDLDGEVQKLATFLSTCSTEAMQKIKEELWRGTEDWDVLLIQNAAISGELVLSESTKAALARFK